MKISVKLISYLLILILGAVWIFTSQTTPDNTTEGEIPAPQKGFLAPDFSLPDAAGNPITLADLRGQPVLVNVWASWCTPCRAEMPAMQRVYETYQAQGFTILAVNATLQDQIPSALSFAQEMGLTFPILFDEQGVISTLYQVQALPTSFFIDADGFIQEVVVGGPMSEALLEIRVQQLIEKTGE
jgi:peroxiredoxin